MKYWYIHSYTAQEEPIWYQGRAYGFRRKNGHDQVFVKTIEGYAWIFAPLVKQL